MICDTMNVMTQDMTKDMRLHTMAKQLVRNWRTRVLSAAHSSELTGALTQRRHLCADEITSRWSRDYVSCPTKLRLVVTMLLMMVLGVSGVWGQTGPVGYDFSGTYYIANHNRKGTSGYDGYNLENKTKNFYLRPSTNTYDVDGEKPFLTTKKDRTNEDPNPDVAKWTIKYAKTEDNTDYYYLIHSSNKYLTWHDPMTINGGASPTDRVRLHLQSTLDEDKALFYFTEGTKGDNDYNICLKGVNCSKNSPGSLNPAKDNKDSETGVNINGAGTVVVGNNTIQCGGLIGIYEQNDPTGVWYLEDVISRPIIVYNSNNLIEITDQTDNATAIYYTTDGTTPTISSTLYSEAFDPDDDVTTIKAVAVVNGELSNVATFTPIVLLGQNHKRLIQSQNNGWTIDENTTDFHFYLIPGDDVGEEGSKITKVNTTSLFRPSMEWFFLNAGVENDVQYYYIVNNANSKYLCYDATNIVYMEAISDGNKFKFSIVESATAGTFNIIPYGLSTGNRFINKDTHNANANPVNLANNGNNNNTRWKFVLPRTLDKTAPFTASNVSTTFYYKINSVGSNGYYIVPPSGNNTNATTSNSNDANVIKTGAWYFEVAQEANETDWLIYYYIRNAETGQYLYFAKDANNAGACLIMKETIETENIDRYMFTWAKTAATEANYYIIPKKLKDASLNNISSLRKGDNNTTISTNTTRGAGNYAWTFTLADLFCNDPVFAVEEGVIKIKCNTNAAKIYINTESDADPTNGSTLYDPTQVTAQNWTENDQVRIKAIAIVSDGTNTASSAVVTLLNKPNVTLEAGPYKYKAAAWEPGVTVSIGEDGNATTAASGTYTTAYANNINAGTANITITDADDTDDLYIWNVPVTEFTIDRVPLTIKAEDKSIGYGDEPDNAGVTYVGFVGNPVETATVLGGTLSYSYTTSGDDPHPYTPYDAQYGNQGTYVITPSGLTSTNYNITFISGTLTVTGKSIGDGSLASGFTLSFDESGEVILKYGTHALIKDVDYTIGDEVSGTKYSSKTISGTGNYTGYLSIRNAIVHFTSDDNQVEWSATFVAESSGENDIGHALPDDISAYLISGIEGTWAIPEPLDYIPAGVPVLLVAHEEKNGFLVSDANSESVNEITNLQKGYNLLKEVTEESAHFNTKQIYVLYKNEFVLNKEGNLGQGKVYMENPNYSTSSPSPAPARLTIIWGNETNIEDIQTNGAMEVGNVRWYTIDGRRLNGKPNAKGLYILNGKKKVVK